MTTSTTERRFFIGWMVVLAAACTGFAQVAFLNPVLGVFIPEFEREFGWSRTEISLGVTFGTFAAAAIAPFVGPGIDRYGGRRFVVGGGAIMTLGLVLLANMQTEWQFFIIYALGRGLAVGVLNVAGVVTVSKWFIERRGTAVGLSTIGNRLGFAALPLGAQLVITNSDWRTATYVLAGIVATVGVLPALRWMHHRPEAMGLLPDNEKQAVADERERKRSESGLAREVNWTRHDAMRTSAFWLITLAISLQTFAGGAVNLHQIPFMVDRGIGEGRAALLLSLFAGFAAVGALLEGFLDHKLGSRITFILGLLVSAGGMVVLMLTHTFTVGVAFAAVYGVGFGLMLTSQQVVFADYFGRESLGAIRGASLPLFMSLQAFGPILAGAVYDKTGSYIAAFMLFTVGYVVAAGALAIARRPRHRSAPLPDSVST